MKNLTTETKRWIWNTWVQYQPDWFVTVLWNDLPTSPIVSSSHTRHLRNKILTKFTGRSRCAEIPDFPDRLGITAFQERTVMQGGKVTFHTHLHLFNCMDRWQSPSGLHCFLRFQVGQSIQKLLKSDSEGNEGIVVKSWSEENHRYYNLKEMERQKKIVLTRYKQDNDLLLDIENSDLLPIQKLSHEMQRNKATLA